MPTAKEEVSQAKAVLGWGANDPRYSSWRNGVKSWAHTNRVTGNRAAGSALWKQFIDYGILETGLPASGKRLIASGNAGTKKVADTALDELLQDVLKKARDTNRIHALRQVADLAAAAPDVEFAPDAINRNTNKENAPKEFRKSMCIFWIDSDRAAAEVKNAGGMYLWDGCPSHCVAIIKATSLLKVVDRVRDRIPAGRTVQAIYGARENPIARRRNPDATRFRSDEEIEAFLEATSAKPIRLQVVLYEHSIRMPAPVNTSPPNDGAYFKDGFLDAPEEYDDPAEDLDTLCRNLAGLAKRTFPKTEDTFEDRKARVQGTIHRQCKVVKLLKPKHRAKFPDANIIDSKDEACTYLKRLPPKVTNLRQMVAARGPVAAGIVAAGAALDGVEDTDGEAQTAAEAKGKEAANATWALILNQSVARLVAVNIRLVL